MNYLNQLTKTLDGYYAKAPVLPKGAKDFIVKASPWLALLGGIIAILSAWGVFQLMTLTNAIANNPFYQAYAPKASGFSITLILSIIVLLVWAVVYFLAFSPLKAGKIKGWNLLLFGMLLYVLSDIVTLNLFSIISGVIGFLIGYYFLYQVKSYYK
jgi:hypothetical protein